MPDSHAILVVDPDEGSNCFEHIIGKSKVMQTVFGIIRRISTTDVNVVITGPSGTGHELVAKALHCRSLRKDKPFVAVECAAIPETLLEAELFGYMKGAFTDAKANKIGILYEANGGTLFFDDVSELSVHLQAKLLRALQEGEIRPLGSTKTIPIDIRIIAATNEDLNKMVKEHRFREDLFYRLNVLNIILPPLADRKEDITILVNHFIKQFSGRMKKSVNRIEEEALKMLMNYDWPGNVRELQNTIERAVALAKGEVIFAGDLPDNLAHQAINTDIAGLLGKPASLKEMERRYILNVIDKFQGNKAKASRYLEIDRKTLYNKLASFKNSGIPLHKE